MTVIIGIDPHKASHTAVAIGCDEQQLSEIRVRATCQQTAKLLAWAEPLGERTWAVESAGGLGYLLSQQLVNAGEEVLDVRRLDVQLKESHKRIKTAVQASGTTLTELYGVGPILACELIGYTGDVRRFTTRDKFASYAGVAPIELSSGGRIVHRLSRRGNRQLNHAIHMVAICQIRQTNSEGRAYFERKVAEGKTKREAIRSLKRHVANAVYRQLLVDTNK
jgi:transposase